MKSVKVKAKGTAHNTVFQLIELFPTGVLDSNSHTTVEVHRS